MPYSSSNITRSIINQSPSPPPNPLLAAYLSHPLLPFNSDYLESPYLQRVLSLSLSPISKYENSKRKPSWNDAGNGMIWKRSLIRNPTPQNRGIRISEAAQAEN